MNFFWNDKTFQDKKHRGKRTTSFASVLLSASPKRERDYLPFFVPNGLGSDSLDVYVVSIWAICNTWGIYRILRNCHHIDSVELYAEHGWAVIYLFHCCIFLLVKHYLSAIHNVNLTVTNLADLTSAQVVELNLTVLAVRACYVRVFASFCGCLTDFECWVGQCDSKMDGKWGFCQCFSHLIASWRRFSAASRFFGCFLKGYGRCP